jgi:hypothetical protein
MEHCLRVLGVTLCTYTWRKHCVPVLVKITVYLCWKVTLCSCAGNEHSLPVLGGDTV